MYRHKVYVCYIKIITALYDTYIYCIVKYFKPKAVSPKKKKESALKKRAREGETESSLDTDRSDISVKSNSSGKSDISSRGDASSSKSSHKKNIFKNVSTVELCKIIVKVYFFLNYKLSNYMFT